MPHATPIYPTLTIPALLPLQVSCPRFFTPTEAEPEAAAFSALRYRSGPSSPVKGSRPDFEPEGKPKAKAEAGASTDSSRWVGGEACDLCVDEVRCTDRLRRCLGRAGCLCVILSRLRLHFSHALRPPSIRVRQVGGNHGR
jgi:hypothetical protein